MIGRQAPNTTTCNLSSLTLYFTDDKFKPLSENEIETDVKATCLHFKDIVVTIEQSTQHYLAIECSGIVSSRPPVRSHNWEGLYYIIWMEALRYRENVSSD